MPKEVDRLPFGGGSNTDWSKYADGKTWMFERGTDFQVKTYSFARNAMRWGQANGFNVYNSVQGETVYVCFTPKKKSKRTRIVVKK